jgi:hypothetical protein
MPLLLELAPEILTDLLKLLDLGDALNASLACKIFKQILTPEIYKEFE